MIMLSCLFSVSAQSSMSIIVKETQVREKPSYLGKVMVVLEYGDKVDTLSLEKDWYKVRISGGREGWIHSSALTKKTIVLKAGQADVNKYASSDDVVLAGKGFNEQVEEKYKKEYNLDFSAIDRIEEIVVGPSEMEYFLSEGGLMEGGR